MPIPLTDPDGLQPGRQHWRRGRHRRLEIRIDIHNEASIESPKSASLTVILHSHGNRCGGVIAALWFAKGHIEVSPILWTAGVLLPGLIESDFGSIATDN